MMFIVGFFSAVLLFYALLLFAGWRRRRTWEQCDPPDRFCELRKGHSGPHYTEGGMP